MNRKERVIAAMENRPVDQIPCSFWRHFSTEENQGEICVRKHIEFYRETGMDFIKVMHDGFVSPCSLVVKNASDLWAYRPAGRKNPYIDKFVERCARIVDAIGDEVYLFCNIFPAMTLLRRIGDEKLLSLIRTDRAAVIHAMDVMSEEIALLSELVIKEAGCLGIFTALQGAEMGRFDNEKEDFEELVRPYDLRVINAAERLSCYNILHFCGWDGIHNHLDYYDDYPGCAVNWAMYVDQVTLEEGRKRFGGRCVMGGFDNRPGTLLYTGLKRSIEVETRRLVDAYVEATGSTNGLILGGDCSYRLPFDTERFTWVRNVLASMKQ